MEVRHPAWFHPVGFSREVIRFSLTEIGFLPPEDFVQNDDDDQEFVEAVQTVGRAVFTLQILIRNRMRSLFINSIHFVAGMLDRLWPSFHEIIQFMDQGYLANDIFETILSVFAIIGELILYMDHIGLNIPDEMYYHPWCNIYVYRLRNRLLSAGGLEMLVEKARIRYIDSGFYREIKFSYRANNPSPYAEVRGEDNWPDISLRVIRYFFQEIPRSTELAMRILRNLYRHRQIVPSPEEEQMWLP